MVEKFKVHMIEVHTRSPFYLEKGNGIGPLPSDGGVICVKLSPRVTAG